MSNEKPIRPESTPAAHVPAPRVGVPGRVVTAIMGLQALACLGFALIFLFVASRSASLSTTSHVMFSVFTALFSVGLGIVALGLWRGRSWSRTAAVVWLALLLPVGWAFVQAGRAVVGALVLGSAVAGIGAVAAESRSPAHRRTP